MKRIKRRLCVKQVNRSVRVHNRDWKRWKDRHTRWRDAGIALVVPFDDEVPF